MFLKISQNCARVSFLIKLQAWVLWKEKLWHRCFPVNFAKFLRTPFLWNTSDGSFWNFSCMNMILSDFQLLFIYWPIACHWSLSIPLKTSEKLRLSDIFGGYRNRPMVRWVNSNIWDKLFKNGPSKICLSRPYPLRFFKSCLPQILLSSCLNTLYHLMLA